MVLLAPSVNALPTLLEVCRRYAGPRQIVYNTMKTILKFYAGPTKVITGSVFNKSQARK